MKTMYLLRPTDGRVMRYNGSWSEQGFLQGLAPARLDARMAATWFKFHGQLWCAVLAERNVFVGTVENGNITPVATFPTAVEKAAWGNAVNVAGQIRWLEHNESGTLLYSFDGTTITTLPVTLPSSSPSIPFDQLMDELNLELVGTRLAVLPRGCVAPPSASPQVLVRNAICLLEITDDGVTVTSAAALEPVTLNIQVPRSENAAGQELDTAIVGAGVYQDNIIALYTDGVLGRLTSGVRAKLGDVRNESFMRLGRYNTTVDGTAKRQVVVDAQRLQADALPYLLGARIFICSGSYAGQAGTVAWIEGNTDLKLRIVGDNNTDFPAIAANVEISFGRGLAGGFVGDVMQPSIPGPMLHTAFFQVSDALYGVVMGRQPVAPRTDRRCQPSFLIRMRGSNVVFTPLQINGQWINAASAAITFDPTDSSIHILAYDSSLGAASVRHLRYSLSSGTLFELSSSFAAPTPIHLASGNIIGYEPGELDISIGTIESDAGTGEVTIAYTIYGDDPSNHVVDFFYNVGAGWVAATPSATPGAAFTFVHALRSDLSDFAGEIQYRASVRRP